jgi:hypothetical protein
MPDPERKGQVAQAELSAEMQKADRLGAFFVTLPKWAGFAVIAWQIRLSIEALAGKYAFPSLLTRFWRQASAWEVVCWIAGMLGLLFGVYTRHLLNRQIARDLARLDSIEKRLDALGASKTAETVGGRSGA